MQYMRLSKEEIFERLDDERPELEELGVEKLGVFGSQVRGNADEESDIDFLVIFKEEEKTYSNYMDLKRFLENLFDTEIDLATRESLKPSIESRVLNEVEYAKKA